MKRALVLVIVMILSSAVTAFASPAETIPAAEYWWDVALNSADLPVPTKKKPFFYGVFPYAAEPCGYFEKKRVDKITNIKGWSWLTNCLTAVSQAEEDAEYLWEPSDVEMLVIGFDYDKKLVKKIRKAVKKLEIVSLEIRGKEDAAAVHVFFAIDKKGTVKGVFMYVDAAG